MQVDLVQQRRDLKKAQALNAVHDEMGKTENMVADNAEENAEENAEGAQDCGMDGDGGGFGED